MHLEAHLCPEAPLGSCDPAKSSLVVGIVLSNVYLSCEHNITDSGNVTLRALMLYAYFSYSLQQLVFLFVVNGATNEYYIPYLS